MLANSPCIAPGRLAALPAQRTRFPQAAPLPALVAASRRQAMRTAAQQGGGSLEPTTAVETVSAWLARHAQDPEELQRQAPVWAALEWLLGSRQEAVALVRREPALLRLAPAFITSNVDIMTRDLRLSPTDIQSSVKKCPQLFLRDYSSQEMQAKFRYIPEVLGRSASLVLAKQPHLLLRSFAGIACKVSFMQHKGDTHYRQTLTFINMSNADFCWHFSYNEAEFAAWEAKHFTQSRWEAM